MPSLIARSCDRLSSKEHIPESVPPSPALRLLSLAPIVIALLGIDLGQAGDEVHLAQPDERRLLPKLPERQEGNEDGQSLQVEGREEEQVGGQPAAGGVERKGWRRGRELTMYETMKLLVFQRSRRKKV